MTQLIITMTMGGALGGDGGDLVPSSQHRGGDNPLQFEQKKIFFFKII